MQADQAEYRTIVQALYAATGKADWQAAEHYLTDDFVVTEAPSVPMAGCYRGRHALRELYQKVFALLDVAGLEVHDLAVGDRHAVCVLDMVLAGPPRVHVPIAEVFVFRGNKVCEIRPHYFDPAPLHAAVREK